MGNRGVEGLGHCFNLNQLHSISAGRASFDQKSEKSIHSLRLVWGGEAVALAFAGGYSGSAWSMVQGLTNFAQKTNEVNRS